MGRYEDYLEMHGNDRWGDEDEGERESCETCGTDYEKLYHFDGETLCEQCLREKYYYGDAIDYPTLIYCDHCGEFIEGEIYCIPGKDGKDEFYDKECLLNIADE